MLVLLRLPHIFISVHRIISSFPGIPVEFYRNHAVPGKPGLEILPDLEEQVVKLCGLSEDSGVEYRHAVQCGGVQIYRSLGHIRIYAAPFVMYDETEAFSTFEGKFTFFQALDRDTVRPFQRFCRAGTKNKKQTSGCRNYVF